MEYYFCIIFLAIGVCGQNYDPSVIPVSSAEVPADKVSNVIPDQNAASDNVNGNYYGDSIERQNYYEGIEGKGFNYARYFGKDYEDILFDEKLSDNEKYERRRGRYFGYDYGNPDIHGAIERPCQVYDSFCIRKFFAEHSRCKVSGRTLPELFYRAQSTFNYPSANISATGLNLQYRGLDKGRVEEFYINKATDNLVIAFYFDTVSLAANGTANLKFYLRGREPEVHQDSGTLSFFQLSITLIIPGLNDLRLDRAEIYTYGNIPLELFTVGPRLALSSDPEVEAMFAYFTTVGLPIELLEELSTEGVFFGTNYLQYNICDFGLKVL